MKKWKWREKEKSIERNNEKYSEFEQHTHKKRDEEWKERFSLLFFFRLPQLNLSKNKDHFYHSLSLLSSV